MGHYKLWAWQHTEYRRIQVLDADVLPLVNMDALFDLPISSPFVGCPGKDSVLNAGWFSLQPDCETFKRMTDLLWYRGMRRPRQWDMSKGWGVPICVEINQCVGCMLALSGDEPASPRHRAGVASMAWRRRDD